VSKVAAAGGSPIMTIGMLPWAAKDPSSYSFSVAKYGAQCAVNPFQSDDGNGVHTDCTTNVTGNDPNDMRLHEMGVGVCVNNDCRINQSEKRKYHQGHWFMKRMLQYKGG